MGVFTRLRWNVQVAILLQSSRNHLTCFFLSPSPFSTFFLCCSSPQLFPPEPPERSLYNQPCTKIASWYLPSFVLIYPTKYLKSYNHRVHSAVPHNPGPGPAALYPACFGSEGVSKIPSLDVRMQRWAITKGKKPFCIVAYANAPMKIALFCMPGSSRLLGLAWQLCAGILCFTYGRSSFSAAFVFSD